MTFKELDTVVLVRDLPEHGQRAGDLGAVVLVHEDGTLGVEFVTASGQTLAMVTLDEQVVRAATATDLPTVRQTDRAD